MTIPASDTDTALLLTVEEAARRLGIGRTMMFRLISTGAVKSVYIGRLRRIPAECLQDYVNGLLASNDQHDKSA